MVTRVAVFVDYQNVYMGARAAFGFRQAKNVRGQIDPHALGLELARRGPAGHDRSLERVRVYRGIPDSRRDPKGNAASLRQSAFWEALPQVAVSGRPLQYGSVASGQFVREKGIDVQLAVDLVMGAVNHDYDCAVVFSADSDLIPALDAVSNLKGSQAVEVATWRSSTGFAPRIAASTGRTWCHYLDRSAFVRVEDRHDYSLGPHPLRR